MILNNVFIVCLIRGLGFLVILYVHVQMEATRIQVAWSYGLHLPSVSWHCGHQWSVSFILSMQKGIRQQGQHPTRQRSTVIKICIQIYIRIGTFHDGLSKCGFRKKSFIMNAYLSSLLGGFAFAPTQKHNKWLLMKSTLW